MMIEEFIQEGCGNAITRDKLEILTGCPDRENRQMIAKYNETADVTPIINKGEGYYKATNPEEVLDVARREYFRAKKIRDNADRLFNAADKMKNKIELRARL